jgi:hypothetical protein
VKKANDNNYSGLDPIFYILILWIGHFILGHSWNFLCLAFLGLEIHQMSCFDVDPREEKESFPCECGGNIHKSKNGWECDSCDFQKLNPGREESKFDENKDQGG